MNMDLRREEFIGTARKLFEEQGVDNVTITQIARRAGVTRSLFYHYFPDKNAIIEAVMDDYANDFMQQAEVWYQNFDKSNPRDSMRTIASLFKSYLVGSPGLGKASQRSDNATLRQLFAVHVARSLSKRFERQIKVLGDLSWTKDLSHPRERYYILLIGLMSLASREPDISDEVIADIVSDVMHFEL